MIDSNRIDSAISPWQDVSANFEVWEMWGVGPLPEKELTAGWQELVKRMGHNVVAVFYTGARLDYRILALVEKQFPVVAQ